MAVRPILVVGNPVLHNKAKKVVRPDASTQDLIAEMIETMRAAPGVGLAAPQIGVPLRLAVIEVDDKLTVMLNPEVVKAQGEYTPEEGCLSVPGHWALVKRAELVTVKALDRHGHEFRVKGEGLFAQVLQHEIDHLNGKLYIDRLDSLEDLRRVEPEPVRRLARTGTLAAGEDD